MNKHDWATGKPIKEGPEESVRQDYEQVLHFDYGYAKNQMDIEVSIQRGSQSREKADIVVYKTTNKNRRSQSRDVLGIVELKRKERKDGVEQLMSYMTATSCSWGVWTNGKEIEYLCKDHTTGEVQKDVIFQIPKKGKSLADIGHFQKRDLKPASNLKLIFRRILQHLYTNADNISRREKLGNEVIRLIFCKLYDEQFNVEDIPDFRVSVDDKSNNFEGVSTRVKNLFSSVKKDLVAEGVFDESEAISLDNKSIAFVVGELQMYSLIGTDEDLVGDAFEVFAESKLVGEKGEFFTPREIIKIAVQIIDPKPGESVIDPACGSGGFLIFALEHIWARMKRARRWRGMPAERLSQERRRMAEKTIYGIDKEIDLVKITKAYMAIIGDGKSSIARQDSLAAAEEFQGDARNLFVEKNGNLKKFDVILTNPPFGSKNTKIVISDAKRFDLGYKWKYENGEYVKTSEARKTPPQELFIERCIDMLKEKGRLAIVLPETYFHAPTKKYIMEWIKRKNSIKAVIDLPHNTFRPHCNAKTLLLILQKGVPQGDVVFGVAEEMGKDHLGKVKKRPENGVLTEEIWDDTQYIRNELSTPTGSGNKHVFCVKNSEIKNNIYVPRYYWTAKDSDIYKAARKEKCHLISMGDLLEQNVIEVFKGHGSPPNEYKGLGDIPYVRAGDIGNWAVYKNPVSAVPEHVYQQVKGPHGIDLQEKDLIFVKEGSYRIGDVAVVLPADTKILLNSHCFVIRLKNHKNDLGIDALYLAYLISHSITKRQLYRKVFIDTTLPNIGDRWRELQLPVKKEKRDADAIKQKMKAIYNRRLQAEEMICALMGGE